MFQGKRIPVYTCSFVEKKRPNLLHLNIYAHLCITHSFTILETCLIEQQSWMYCRVYWIDFIVSQKPCSLLDSDNEACWPTSDWPTSFSLYSSACVSMLPCPLLSFYISCPTWILNDRPLIRTFTLYIHPSTVPYSHISFYMRQIHSESI